MAVLGPDVKSGDVVIRDKGGLAIVQWAAVLDDGTMPHLTNSGTKAEAEKWAAEFVGKTGGRIHRWSN